MNVDLARVEFAFVTVNSSPPRNRARHQTATARPQHLKRLPRLPAMDPDGKRRPYR